jgi:LPS sulfotransferase NodH
MPGCVLEWSDGADTDQPVPRLRDARSGTSLLCGLLAGTGMAGHPEEYFWRGDEPVWSERWGVSRFADYLRAAIAHGSTPYGVFGAKIMWGDEDPGMALRVA